MSLSRRVFLQTAGLATAHACAASGLPFYGLLRDAGDATHLVVVMLRGGLDGLEVLVPHGDPGYARLRRAPPSPHPSLDRWGSPIDLDGFFALAPCAAPLHSAWLDGHVGFVTGVGLDECARSHFAAQARLESVGPDGRGWLASAMESLPQNTDMPGAVVLGMETPPSLAGASSVACIGPDSGIAWHETNSEALERAGGRPWRRSWSRSAESVVARSTAGAGAPDSLSSRLRQVGALLATGIAPRVAWIDSAGWDTHERVSPDGFSHSARVAHLADGLCAFREQAGRSFANVLLVTITEFGRTLNENPAGGTDHGAGTVSILMGGSIAGRTIHGSWPAGCLDAPDDDAAMPVTTDTRQLVARLLRDHLGDHGAAGRFGPVAFDVGGTSSLLARA